MRVLVVEDDRRMAGLLERGLMAEGYAVDAVGTVEDATFMGAENPYDAIVMDLNLPDGDGLDVCRTLRAAGHWSPVLILTARTAVEDRVRGLDVGADDYLVKPFSFAELAARLRALVRRGAPERPAVLCLGSLALDPAAHRAWSGDDDLALTRQEFAVLELLMRRAGETLSRAELLDHAWDWAYDGTSNVVDVCIAHLRAKLGAGGPAIDSVRGVGYRLGPLAPPSAPDPAAGPTSVGAALRAG